MENKTGKVPDLRAVVSDYHQFCHVAEELSWIAIKERHGSFYGGYPLRIDLDVYEFPAGYVANNMVQAYVRGVLSNMAFYEEWDRDFWRISQSERKFCLENGKELYQGYVIPGELRLIERDWKYLVKEIEVFSKADKVSFSEWKRYLDRFHDAMVIEIGGYYTADYEYLAIKNDNMLLVSCGCWD